MNIFKRWLLKHLLSSDEKYLLNRAIEDRVENLSRIKINEKWADACAIDNDIVDYVRFTAFVLDTRDWKSIYFIPKWFQCYRKKTG